MAGKSQVTGGWRARCGCRVIVSNHTVLRVEHCMRHEEARQRRAFDLAARHIARMMEMPIEHVDIRSERERQEDENEEGVARELYGESSGG